MDALGWAAVGIYALIAAFTLVAAAELWIRKLRRRRYPQPLAKMNKAVHSWQLKRSGIGGLEYKWCTRCGALWELRGQWDGNPQHQQHWDWDPEPMTICDLGQAKPAVE